MGDLGQSADAARLARIITSGRRAVRIPRVTQSDLPLAPEVREKFGDVGTSFDDLKLGPGAFHRLVRPTSSVVLVNEELRPYRFQAIFRKPLSLRQCSASASRRGGNCGEKQYHIVSG